MTFFSFKSLIYIDIFTLYNTKINPIALLVGILGFVELVIVQVVLRGGVQLMK